MQTMQVRAPRNSHLERYRLVQNWNVAMSRGAFDGFQDSNFCFPVLYLLYVLNTSYRAITKMFNYLLHFLANFHIIIHYV